MIWILGKTVLCLCLLVLIRLEYMLLPIKNVAFQYIQLSKVNNSHKVQPLISIQGLKWFIVIQCYELNSGIKYQLLLIVKIKHIQNNMRTQMFSFLFNCTHNELYVLSIFRLNYIKNWIVKIVKLSSVISLHSKIWSKMLFLSNHLIYKYNICFTIYSFIVSYYNFLILNGMTI